MLTETDILVIGGGIAGFSAALCAARLGHSINVLTGATLGGHLISIELIEGFPGFEEGIALGAEVNVTARMTRACREGVRRFLSRPRD